MILAIDQGTSGTTCLVFDEDGPGQRPRLPRVHPALPAPGLGRARRRRDLGRHARRGAARRSTPPASTAAGWPASASPTSARRSWPGTATPASRCTARSSGRTAAPPRAATSCARPGHEPLVRERTGLVLDPYFSGTKIEWLIRHGDVPARRRLRHDRLLARLQAHRRARDRLLERLAHAAVRHRRACAGTPSCASCWACRPASLPEPRPSAEVYGETTEFGGSVPVAGIAGDQQAALYGQACHERGLGKNTYGTGSFVLQNAGDRAARAVRGPAHDGRLGRGRARRLRARGRDLRHRRRGAVAARRARDHRRRRRDRGARPLARLQRRRLPRARLHGARLAALGPLRARDDRGAHARHRARPPRARRARGDGLPDGRRACARWRTPRAWCSRS